MLRGWCAHMKWLMGRACESWRLWGPVYLCFALGVSDGERWRLRMKRIRARSLFPVAVHSKVKTNRESVWDQRTTKDQAEKRWNRIQPETDRLKESTQFEQEDHQCKHIQGKSTEDCLYPGTESHASPLVVQDYCPEVLEEFQSLMMHIVVSQIR